MIKKGTNILVVCLDNLGDMIMSTCLIEPLKRKFPDSKISYWVKKDFACLVENDPFVDHVYGVNPFWVSSPYWALGNSGEYFKNLRVLKKKKFDVVFIANACWRKALSLIFVPVRIGVAQKKSSLFLTRRVSQRQIEPKHRGYAYQCMLQKYDISDGEVFTRIICPKHLPPAVKLIGSKYKLADKNVFVFHVYSTDARRDWPEQNYLLLAEKLLKKYSNIKIMVLYGSCDEEKLKKLFSGIQDIIMERTALIESVSCLNQSSLFIGPDSGPLHLASALSVPTISFFSNPPSWKAAPMGRSANMIFNSSDLAGVSVESVMDAVESLSKIWKERLW